MSVSFKKLCYQKYIYKYFLSAKNVTLNFTSLKKNTENITNHRKTIAISWLFCNKIRHKNNCYFEIESLLSQYVRETIDFL